MEGSDAESLQRCMKEVRHDLEDDFQGMTDKVREFGSWSSYVKKYPWVTFGAVALLGYVVIPRTQRQRTAASSIPARATQVDRLAINSNAQPRQELYEVAIRFVGGAILQGLSSYIGNRVGSVLEAYHGSPQTENTLEKGAKSE